MAQLVNDAEPSVDLFMDNMVAVVVLVEFLQADRVNVGLYVYVFTFQIGGRVVEVGAIAPRPFTVRLCHLGVFGVGV